MKKQKEENLKTNEKVNIAVLKDTEKKENNENQNINSQKTSQRILSIDRFRGICMFAMVCSFVFGLFASFGALAPLIEHGTKGFEILPGVSFADLFAPMFIFVVGLTIVPSFKKREEKFGTVNAYLQLAIRFLSIMGIGCLLNGFEDGWADVFTGTAFSELSINTKIYAIGFWVALALVINLIISLFTKNEKYKNISKTLLFTRIMCYNVDNFLFWRKCYEKEITYRGNSRGRNCGGSRRRTRILRLLSGGLHHRYRAAHAARRARQGGGNLSIHTHHSAGSGRLHR